MSSWALLDRELDAWREGGRQATLWCRDDDASHDSPALQRLFAIASAHEVPVALATIPATLAEDLVDAVAPVRTLTVVQHGFAHGNHAPPGDRSCELGAHRGVEATMADLADGRARLARAFDTRFHSLLVPPWNRIDPRVIARLPAAGYVALSTFGPRPAPWAAPGVIQCNTHVDLIAWRQDRAFIGADRAIERTVAHLRARREGLVDSAEPTGILTHHLDFDDAAWTFLAELMVRTKTHGAARWLDVPAVIAAGAATPPVTSVRSA
jgi:hypothetical protein